MSLPQDPELARSTSGWVEVFVGVLVLAIGLTVVAVVWPIGVFLLWLLPAFGALWLVFGARNVRKGARRARRVAAVLSGGTRTSATVLALDQVSSGGEGHDPEVLISLRVPAPGGGTRRVSARYGMPVTLIPRVQPGAELPVVLNPADRDLVVVDWRTFTHGPATWSGWGDNAGSGDRAGAGDRTGEVDLSEVDELLAAGRLGRASELYLRLTGASYAEAKVALKERLAEVKRRQGR